DRVDVTTDHAMLPLGLHARLTAMVHFTDGHTADFSDRVVWMSADAMIASVAPDGGVTANALGATEISATFMGLTGKTSIEVTAARLTEIAITPMPPIAKGLHAQLAATGTYSDGTKIDITTNVTWAVVDATIATVDAAGIVDALAVGSTDVHAALDEMAGA